MASPSSHVGSIGTCGDKHRSDNRLVAGATADIPRDRFHNFFTSRVGIVIEQYFRRHNHAGGAKAALGRESFCKGALEWMEHAVPGQTVCRLYIRSVAGLRKGETGEA